MGSDHPLARAQAHRERRGLPPAALALLACAPLAVASTAGAANTRGPFALVTLPSLGAVTWSCATPDEMWGLSVRVARRSATTRVRFRVGAVRGSRTLDPGERTRFPTVRARHHRLRFEQATGAGVLRARVHVEFATPGSTVSHCAPYAPPRIDVHVEPR